MSFRGSRTLDPDPGLSKMHPILASLPIIALVLTMAVRAPRIGLPLPASVALPGAAAAALALQILAGRDAGAAVLTARVIEGLLTALMPLAIVFGAVVLFRTLVASGAMAVITSRLERSAPDPVVRVLLIGWSFSYLVEGLSGFGTPAALAAPLLVGMGFPPVRAAAACLAMNTVPVVFGAVGTPIWFGLDALALGDDEMRSVRILAALMQCAIAPVIVVSALRMLFPWSEIRARALAIGGVVLCTVGPSTAVATVSSEFPSIIGGVAGLAAAFVAGRFVRRGIAAHGPRGATPALSIGRAAFPLVATVFLLAATRIEPLGLRELLNAQSPSLSVDLGAMGEFFISAALVVGLDGIVGTDIAWQMPMLYVPFIIPFLVVSLASAPLLRMSIGGTARVWRDAAGSLGTAAIALAGALVFVKLMMHGGDHAPVVLIGRALADGVGAVHGSLWIAGAPLVGALGSFFSGSATVSNLTFGAVQQEIAVQLGLHPPRVLALQAVGAAIGNMVCVHNMVAVAAVLGLSRRGPTTDTQAALVRQAADDPIATMLRLNFLPLAAAAAVAALTAAAVGWL